MPSTAALALVTLGLLVLGHLLFAALATRQSSAGVIREVWPILWVETLIAVVVAGTLWWGGWVLVLALLAHAARVAYEALYVAGAHPNGLDRGRRLYVLAFPLLPLAVFTIGGMAQTYTAWLLLAYILVEVFDSFALLGGKLFGRTKAFPELSPNKTIEGLAAGAVMLMLVAAGGAAVLGTAILPAMGLALLVAPLAVTGDLAASKLKRMSGVKDFPKVLPHQGGLLDTTDAWIVTGAVFVMLAHLQASG
ncbi:Phosphatidate cytidylyltransferase [Candidatus Rhodobacter oscarellae]|uniref:Phosphatidate cytidylyltransferase n=1 Tax=Candidatus Rhodobacter oscarellae TaxID=1675527 RepID=A0A0J9E3U6_9RHOB|nr:phosphatidate cytidylyltransferase [Candidatus Rhodobacter lobularis]KMW57387.1 Phosphatidate cytidylyltransferase [Candidatus Rhodobacter lobularis]